MATRKSVGQENEAPGGEVLQRAAKAIGAVIGTIAANVGVVHPEERPVKRGKLEKTAKKRLPRKEKKQAKKALTPHSS